MSTQSFHRFNKYPHKSFSRLEMMMLMTDCCCDDDSDNGNDVDAANAMAYNALRLNRQTVRQTGVINNDKIIITVVQLVTVDYNGCGKCCIHLDCVTFFSHSVGGGVEEMK